MCITRFTGMNLETKVARPFSCIVSSSHPLLLAQLPRSLKSTSSSRNLEGNIKFLFVQNRVSYVDFALDLIILNEVSVFPCLEGLIYKYWFSREIRSLNMELLWWSSYFTFRDIFLDLVQYIWKLLVLPFIPSKDK